ncbi:hypothetical protein C484_09306 [Natrialba taiwanensis DSM 12281]|uniref:Uncharacterized protein n=1 Tax=Natrialba taiwanensis DSM 12281 TaxID=1230458 RepID=M0A1H5_9EURY|nr:hypothetical protein C484_09306 [Natrialba taiwanensis DSM 12281]
METVAVACDAARTKRPRESLSYDGPTDEFTNTDGTFPDGEQRPFRDSRRYGDLRGCRARSLTRRQLSMAPICDRITDRGSEGRKRAIRSSGTIKTRTTPSKRRAESERRIWQR